MQLGSSLHPALDLELAEAGVTSKYKSTLSTIFHLKNPKQWKYQA